MLFTRLLQSIAVPTQCALCRDWGRDRICNACCARFATPADRCEACALRVPAGMHRCGACLGDPPPFDATLTALDYGHPWDHLIGRFKFHAALDLAGPLAQQLIEAWRASGGPRPELLLPVPLAAPRLRERGYNQAWEIARRLARRIGCKTDPHALLRIKDTPHQLAFPPERRAANVRAAFAVEPARRESLRGRRVTLVDDVMTTGATAAELARVLKRAGAAQVDVWVVARTPAPTE
ncbi:MAG TPA: ComF family protein [Albitalea sp.]